MRTRSGLTLCLLLAFAAGLPVQLYAQSAAESPDAPSTVISANPFGLLLNLFNAEIERVHSPTTTFGVGGSFIVLDDADYQNIDAFARFYPSGDALNGWAFGAKAGVTRIPESGSYVGLGFDVNWSQLLGPREEFYVGIGFGLKRLITVDDNFMTPRFVPTFRIINVGWSFR